MADEAKLVLHCGARQVSRADLEAIEAPSATSTWFPIAHRTVIDAVTGTLTSSGFVVKREQFGLARNDARMFATLDLASELAPGVTLSVGVRNSTDKSFPLGFTAGSRVFVCDNLAFRSDILVTRKHTRFGRQRFEGGIVPHRALPAVIAEWRKPSFEEFRPRTGWSLLNAFTTALGKRAKSYPQEYARTTMKLGAMVDLAVGLKPFVLPVEGEAVPALAS